jgi:hypothetical protein
MRPVTRRAILLFALIPGAITTASIVSNHGRRDYWLGFRAGLLATFILMAIGWCSTIRFEGRHLDESAEFWAGHEALIRPLAFRLAIGFGVLLLPAALVLWGFADRVEAGAATTGFLDCVVVFLLLFGKVP